MRTKVLPLIYLSMFFVISATSCKDNTKANTMEAPIAKIISKELVAHEHIRTDNYYWLNEREDPEVISYLNSENDYTTAKLKHTEPFQAQLYDELIGRIKQDDNTVPYFENGYWYYTRYNEGQEYPVYCRKKSTLEATEKVLLDVNKLAEGYAYYSASGLAVSPNNKILAFGQDTLSRRIYKVRFLNIETGEFLTDEIENTTGRATWAADNKTVFFSQKDKALRSYKIFRYQLGDENSLTEIFHEDDETYNTFVYKTKSNKFIVIGSSSTVADEYKVLAANKPDGKFKMFQKRERGLEHSIAHFGDKFYVRTNLEALNFRLMETSETATQKENWTEIIAHRSDVLLEGMEIFKNFLVLEERSNGLTQLRIIVQKDKTEHYLPFSEQAYTAYIGKNPEFDTKTLRFGYSSLTTPSSVYDYNMVSKEKELMKETEVLGGFNKDNYEAKRVFATATDGTKVPISLVYKKDTEISSNTPLLLYAYGSYGYSMDPYFSSARLSLLDRGFVYAIAHIRGGQEMGRYWYEDGKMLNKKNTFTDFVNCAEYLIAEKYTSPDNLFAMGGSAGGLLMGAIINSAPDLFNGVIAAVPFVDVVTTMLDESIPLTTGEFDEWGNPKIKKYYDYMLSYSPYDNVAAQNYPNLLVTTGLHDSQVQYWEPAKWVAKLRATKTDDNLLLLHTNMEAGHGGASGRFRRFKETALEYAFVLDLAGISE